MPMDYCTETEKRSRQTRDQSKKVVYRDGRIRIATDIASTSKHTPSRILLTSSMTAHSILSCTRPGDKIPYPPSMSPPLKVPGNPIIVEDSDKELDRQDNNFIQQN